MKSALALRWMVVVAGLGCAPPGQAVDPLPPNLEKAPLEVRARYWDQMGRQSLDQKIQAGRQRYQKQAAFQRSIAQQLKASSSTRLASIRRERAGQEEPSATSPRKRSKTLVLTGISLLVVGLLWRRVRCTPFDSETPGVFGTSQLDFEADSQSPLHAANELIGKPLLMFKLAVKTLRFALWDRLKNLARLLDHSTAPSPSGPTPAEAPAASNRMPHSPLLRTPASPTAPASRLVGEAAINEFLPPSSEAGNPFGSRLSTGPSREFLVLAARRMAGLRELLSQVSPTEEEAVRQQKLGDLYLRMHALTADADLVSLGSIARVSFVLEALIKKLFIDPKSATSSALRTAAHAAELLQDVCVPGLPADFATHPPVRMLVVNDDPPSCRALTCALQMAFERPDSAESGEAALALAGERPYEVIFLDMVAAATDGFTFYSRIRRTVPNRHTPVVFVAPQTEFDACTEPGLRGESDLLAKPFLSIELTVKALTFALRGRLQKIAAP